LAKNRFPLSTIQSQDKAHMKNLYIKISILLLTQLCCTAVNAQIEKGTWMATGKITMYPDPLRFSIQGDVGYMLSNRLMLIPAGTTSHDLFRLFPRLETHEHARWYEKSTNQKSMLGKREEF
jgi:hypothetical protein